MTASDEENLIQPLVPTPEESNPWMRSGSRLLDRRGAFHQSRGHWNVRHIARSEASVVQDPQGSGRTLDPFRRFWNSWFYTLAYQKTYVLITILFFSYTAIVFLFACAYLALSLGGQTTRVDPVDGSTSIELFCGMDIFDIVRALYFSLAIMSNGVSNNYFNSCWSPFLLVLFQVCCSIVFDAIAIGLIFQRISRGNKRAKTIVFSDKATIRCVRGVPCLYFRICELCHRDLVEASVKAYCVMHDRQQLSSHRRTRNFVTRPLKLGMDGFVARILMNIPQVVAHQMDGTSPLRPPNEWINSSGKIVRCRDMTITEAVREFAGDRDLEIIVVAEGTDESTGTVIQTRHSYTYNDMVWNHEFTDCILPAEISNNDEGQDAPKCIVDFSRFHQTYPVHEEDEDYCPYFISPPGAFW